MNYQKKLWYHRTPTDRSIKLKRINAELDNCEPRCGKGDVKLNEVAVTFVGEGTDGVTDPVELMCFLTEKPEVNASHVLKLLL
jgi:hypothetical protein